MCLQMCLSVWERHMTLWMLVINWQVWRCRRPLCRPLPPHLCLLRSAHTGQHQEVVRNTQFLMSEMSHIFPVLPIYLYILLFTLSPANLGSNVWYLSFWIFPSGVFQHAYPSVSVDTGLHSDSTVNYVNIPTSLLPAKTNRELLYTELDLQEPGFAPVSSLFNTDRSNNLQLCRQSKSTEP